LASAKDTVVDDKIWNGSVRSPPGNISSFKGYNPELQLSETDVSDNFRPRVNQMRTDMRESLDAAPPFRLEPTWGHSFRVRARRTHSGLYIKDFDAMNAVYREFFPQEQRARTTVGAQLPKIEVEIDCIARVSERRKS
jgi:hypothetical protein